MPRKGMRSIFFQPSPPPSMFAPPSPLRTFSDSLMDENIETAESLITKWDYSNANQSKQIITPLFSASTRHEARQYLNAVKGLQSAMQYLVTRDSSSNTLVKAQFLMQLAMKTLQKEFYQILSQNRECLDPETVSNRSSVDRRSSVSLSDYEDDVSVSASDDEFRMAGNTISETESVSMLAMADLKAIADCMISSGYGKECVKVYTIMRKSIVDEAIYHLGVDRLSLSQIQKMDWDVLELKIKMWLNAVKVSIGTLFHGERILCDEVFANSSGKRIAESCFAEITKEGAASLFGFPEMVAKSKITPEKMFRILDLYEAISDHFPQIQSIFSFESTSTVRLQAVTSMTKLADAVKTMLKDFEAAIQKESSKKEFPGGGVHPITRYVMNYITFLADYSGVLSDIVFDLPQSPMPESYFQSPMRGENQSSSEISEKIAWLILVLLCKLDVKAELYKDVALSYLFLANNMQYVVVKVRRSNLGFLLGEDWLTNHESKVREYVSKFVRYGWNKVFSTLPEDPTAEMPVEKVKASFLNFNAAFDRECRKQASWVVPDPKLRDEIKGAVGSELLSRYGGFYEMNRVGFESIVRYEPEYIESCLSKILYGVGDSGSVSSFSSTTSSSHGSNSR